MKPKKIQQKMRTLNKVAAQNLKSRSSARQFLKAAGVELPDHSKGSGWMTVISTCSAEGWMIISAGGWD